MNRIRTRTRNPISRGVDALWRACDQRQALPLTIVGLLLAVVCALN